MAIFTAIAGLIFGAGTFLAAAGAVVLQVAAGIGLSLAARALSGQPDSPDVTKRQPYALQGTLQSGGDLARSILFGFSATAGSLAWRQTWGNDGETPNAYLTEVIALSDYPVDELAEVWINGEKVTVLSTGATSAGFPVSQYRKGGKDYLWVKFHDGTQTAADSFLVSKSTTARPYQSTRVGFGVAYVIVTARIDEGLFSGFPTYRFVLNGAKLYDISRDSTAGGSGTQRWSTPSTWGGDGDRLPVVQAYNILRGITFGGVWLYGLQNLPAARLPAAHWIAQIAKCRTMVAGPAGNENTYRAGGEVKVGTNFGDTIDQLMTACHGRMTESGGIYKPFVGQPGSPVVAFDDGDILSTEEQTFSPFFGLADTINGITASYPNPAEGWNMKEAPPLYRTDLEALVGNRRLPADVTFDLVPYSGQVQRLMKSALQEAQRARRHTLVLPSEFWALEPGEVVAWTSARNGYDAKQFRVDGYVDQGNLDVLVDITEVDPADYDWDQETDYREPVDGPLSFLRPSPQPIVDWFAEGDTDIIGGKQRACIRLSWDPDVVDDLDLVLWEVRRGDNLQVVDRGNTNLVDAGEVLISHNIFSGTLYGVRGRYHAFSGREMLWSDWLAVTTPNTPYTDILVELDKVAEDVRHVLEGLYRDVRNIRDDFETFAANVGSANVDDVVQKSLFRKRVGRMSAQIINESVLRVTADEALAQQTTLLESRMDDTDGTIEAQAIAVQQLETSVTNLDGFVTAMSATLTEVEAKTDYGTASGLFGMTATSGPAGVTVRLQAVAQSEIGGDQYNAGWLLDLFDDGTSQFILDVTKFIVISGSTKFRPMVFSGGVLQLDQISVNGANIINGTIGSAKIANAAITSAKIGNLEVDTIHIANGAIARSAPASGTGNTGGVEGANIIVCSATVANPSGSAVVIDLSVSNNITVSGNQGSGAPNTLSCQIKVTRNGTLIGKLSRLFLVNSNSPGIGSYHEMGIDLPGIGTHVYRTEIQITASTAGTGLNHAVATSTMLFSWTSK